MLHLAPAYCRDYKSKSKVEADLLAGKDFVDTSLFGGGGRYCNLQDLQDAGETQVQVRYRGLTKVCVLDVPARVAAAPKPSLDAVAPAADLLSLLGKPVVNLGAVLQATLRVAKEADVKPNAAPFGEAERKFWGQE